MLERRLLPSVPMRIRGQGGSRGEKPRVRLRALERSSRVNLARRRRRLKGNGRRRGSNKPSGSRLSRLKQSRLVVSPRLPALLVVEVKANREAGAGVEDLEGEEALLQEVAPLRQREGSTTSPRCVLSRVSRFWLIYGQCATGSPVQQCIRFRHSGINQPRGSYANQLCYQRTPTEYYRGDSCFVMYVLHGHQCPLKEIATFSHRLSAF